LEEFADWGLDCLGRLDLEELADLAWRGLTDMEEGGFTTWLEGLADWARGRVADLDVRGVLT